MDMHTSGYGVDNLEITQLSETSLEPSYPKRILRFVRKIINDAQAACSMKKYAYAFYGESAWCAGLEFHTLRCSTILLSVFMLSS